MYAALKTGPVSGLASTALVVSMLGIAVHSAAAADVVSGVDSLTLEAALALAMERNPGLAARQLEIKAREARVLQAGKGPNPEISLEAENFAGSGPYSGVDGLETTLGVSQVLETGGKRAARAKAAGSETELARWDLKTDRMRLGTQVRSAFAEVLAAQERLHLLQSGLEVNKQILETAKLRHHAGKAPATEEMKARMAYSLAHIEIDRAVQELSSANVRLASYWSDWSAESPDFQGAKGDLRILPDLPSLESLLPRLDSHPDLARWKAEADQRRYALEAARAEARPDLSIGGGVRHLGDGGAGDVALVAGVSMPLPFRNRNQGSIRESEHRLAKAEKERRAAGAELAMNLRTLHQRLVARGEELAHLKDELLPEAGKTLDASREAYRLGKLSFLEVLDSQRMVNELGTRYISSLAEYHRDWNELLSLTSYGERPKF